MAKSNTQNPIASVQIDRFASELNRAAAKGKCSPSLLLSAAVLAFQVLDSEQKAEWLKQAQAKRFGSV